MFISDFFFGHLRSPLRFIYATVQVGTCDRIADPCAPAPESPALLASSPIAPRDIFGRGTRHKAGGGFHLPRAIYFASL